MLTRDAFPVFALALVVVAVALCIPLHVYPLSNYIEELWVALGVIGCSAWLFWRGGVFRFSVLTAMWLVLGCIFFFSAFFHESTFFSGKAFYIVFWFLGFLSLLISDQVDWSSDQASTALAWIVFSSALVCAVGGFFRHYGWLWDGAAAFVPQVNTGRMVGLVGHSNFFAFICLIGMCGGAWLFNRGRVRLWLLALSGFLFIYGVVLSGSRAALLAWCVLLICVWVRRRKLQSDRLVRALAVSAFAFLIVQPLAGYVDDFLSGFASGLSQVDGRLFEFGGRGVGSSGRLDEWNITLDVFLDHPLTGVGIGNYASAGFEKHIALGVPSPGGLFSHSHNLILQMAAELGLVGLVWLMAFLALCAKGVWEGLADIRRVLPVSVLLVFFVYSQFEFPYWIMHFLVLNLLLTGAVGGKHFSFEVKLGKFFSAILVFLFLSVSAIYVPLAERFYWSFKQYLQRAPVEVGEYSFMNSMIADPLLEPYGYLIYVANFQVSPKSLEREITVLRRFRDYRPYAPVLVRLAILEVAAGNTENGRRVINDARIFYGSASIDTHVLSQLEEAERAFPDVDFTLLRPSKAG
ncbi:PglL family O-oligosaccharyltransferase [Pseudomonas sp. ENNP23]|uniref:PglL family O-oligosaccharyltransferase n=1 Tax=Pseudomonas sp. ENNP23 TaxID=1535636 RepID=UPI0009F2C17E|nr:O-antigen ligase family protein [Pseudomonas sp. ENNP23]